MLIVIWKDIFRAALGDDPAAVCVRQVCHASLSPEESHGINCLSCRYLSSLSLIYNMLFPSKVVPVWSTPQTCFALSLAVCPFSVLLPNTRWPSQRWRGASHHRNASMLHSWEAFWEGMFKLFSSSVGFQYHTPQLSGPTSSVPCWTPQVVKSSHIFPQNVHCQNLVFACVWTEQSPRMGAAAWERSWIGLAWTYPREDGKQPMLPSSLP